MPSPATGKETETSEETCTQVTLLRLGLPEQACLWGGEQKVLMREGLESIITKRNTNLVGWDFCLKRTHSSGNIV